MCEYICTSSSLQRKSLNTSAWSWQMGLVCVQWSSGRKSYCGAVVLCRSDRKCWSLFLSSVMLRCWVRLWSITLLIFIKVLFLFSVFCVKCWCSGPLVCYVSVGEDFKCSVLLILLVIYGSEWSVFTLCMWCLMKELFKAGPPVSWNVSARICLSWPKKCFLSFTLSTCVCEERIRTSGFLREEWMKHDCGLLVSVKM